MQEEGAEGSRQSAGMDLKEKKGQVLIVRSSLGEHGTDRRELVSHALTSCLRTEAMPHGSLCLAHLGPVVCDSGL